MGKVLKRIVDISISLPATVILLPVFAGAAIAIRLTSKGPVIFEQERAGREIVNLPLHPCVGSRTVVETVEFITCYTQLTD